jgi:rare lipoprotein A (peptidoglycan hydrolase)
MQHLVAAAIGMVLLLASAHAEEGPASVDYGRVTRFDAANYHGRVATGERYSAGKLAVAHRTLPLGSYVAVSYRGRTVIAVVNDRGPCLSAYCRRTAPKRVGERVLDMTPAVAAKLRFPGLGRVTFWPV